MVALTIDGLAVQAEEGTTVLEAARSCGVHIPTFCYHEGLAPYGACRLCVVEVSHQGRTQIEASCVRQAEGGMVVRTHTAPVCECRRLAAEALLARCPDSQKVKELAQEVEVADSTLRSVGEACVLCGLCIRACEAAIGASAIRFADTDLALPARPRIEIDLPQCTGCGACAAVCPTEAIRIEDDGPKRYLRYLDVEVELQECSGCGRYFTAKGVLRVAGELFEVEDELRELCGKCRREHLGRLLFAGSSQGAAL